MERQWYTRNALTGAMMMLAFVLVWLPSPYGYNLAIALDWIKQNDSTAIVGLVTAVLSTPFVGFILGALVQAVWYFSFGQPYKNKAVKKFREEMLDEMNRQGYSEVRSQIRGMSPLEVFCYFYYSFAPKELIEWSRRRRTAEMLGYNWTAAIVAGGILAWRVDGAWHIVKWPSVLFLFWIAFHAMWVSRKARKEADEVEILWGKNYIDKDPLRRFLPKSNNPDRKARSKDSPNP